MFVNIKVQPGVSLSTKDRPITLSNSTILLSVTRGNVLHFFNIVIRSSYIKTPWIKKEIALYKITEIMFALKKTVRDH